MHTATSMTLPSSLLKQDPLPAVTSATGNSGGPRPTVTIVIIVLILFALVAIFVSIARAYLIRRSNSRPSMNSNGIRTTRLSRDSLILSSRVAAGVRVSPLLPPAVVRIQRHTTQSSSGISLKELDSVAPIQPYHPSNLTAEEHTICEDEDDIVCPICLEDIQIGVKSRTLLCKHTFHSECIEEWVTKANRCPVCNTNVIDKVRLEKSRIAILQGINPPPLLNSSTSTDNRHRRRRTRGQNGIFELLDGSSVNTNTSFSDIDEQQQRSSVTTPTISESSPSTTLRSDLDV